MPLMPLLGKSLDELKDIVRSFGMPPFTAKQIAEWLYKKNADSIDNMTNISKINRDTLSRQYRTGRTPFVQVAESSDGTKKYLFKTADNRFIETVYIPEPDRATLCVSSQVGCRMNCLFCMTGRQGFAAQLSTDEILNQMVSVPEFDRLTNIVYMGMGEPLDNLDPVLKSIELLTADDGMGWSPRRITLSTIGLTAGLKTFLEKSSVHLAVSLHSPFPAERGKLMPIEKAFPMENILAELKKYDFGRQRRLSFEYILFEGVNDTRRHAVRLAKLLRGLDCRVNLIRFHPIPDVALGCSDEINIIAFRDYLTDNGIVCTVRKSRGEDIRAACGMLSTLECAKHSKDTHT
ncbi:MAG: 23S rRNA (adenine(2503)-C(2))-methyltransferase RlmN [Prevotellaceae bacterium]|jgi:23S rRNA (adenine2503-C2)-methyltransferase|nr:23S rRNA (adenine(2503)-C(2))-methyltransferase RlmN [Prevotellaceae bacterium]